MRRCVADGPMFSTALERVQGETVLRDGRFAYTDYRLVAGAPKQ